MTRIKHLFISVLFILLITLLGTAGYMIVEGWDFVDSLYMTVITLTTVGYGEIHEVSRFGQIYTIVLIISGVGFSLYVIGAIVQFVVEGRVQNILGRRRLDKRIKQLSNHYIICGYGRIGQVLCEKLIDQHKKLVIIEKNENISNSPKKGTSLYIIGNAADEHILMKAGIDRAAGLVAALGTDTDNVFLVLTARQLNPDLYIMARASHNECKAKLIAAGANQVESPYDLGATRMAQRITRPTVTGFLDMAVTHRREDIQMEEIPVDETSPLVNITLKESGIRQNFNLIIIAIQKSDETMIFNPSFDTVIQGGDTVIAVGKQTSLQQLEKVLNPHSPG